MKASLKTLLAGLLAGPPIFQYPPPPVATQPHPNYRRVLESRGKILVNPNVSPAISLIRHRKPANQAECGIAGHGLVQELEFWSGFSRVVDRDVANHLLFEPSPDLAWAVEQGLGVGAHPVGFGQER